MKLNLPALQNKAVNLINDLLACDRISREEAYTLYRSFLDKIAAKPLSDLYRYDANSKALSKTTPSVD